MDVEFFVDAAEVGADGFRADAEAGGDFLVRDAFGEKLQISPSRGESPCSWSPSAGVS